MTTEKARNKFDGIKGLLDYAQMYGLRPISENALAMVHAILEKEVQVEGFPETHFTVNDWAQRFFEVRFQESPERTVRMVRVLTERPGLSFLVVQGDSEHSFLWCSRSSFRYLMTNWTEVDSEPPAEAVGG